MFVNIKESQHVDDYCYVKHGLPIVSANRDVDAMLAVLLRVALCHAIGLRVAEQNMLMLASSALPEDLRTADDFLRPWDCTWRTCVTP